MNFNAAKRIPIDTTKILRFTASEVSGQTARYFGLVYNLYDADGVQIGGSQIVNITHNGDYEITTNNSTVQAIGFVVLRTPVAYTDGSELPASVVLSDFVCVDKDYESIDTFVRRVGVNIDNVTNIPFINGGIDTLNGALILINPTFAYSCTTENIWHIKKDSYIEAKVTGVYRLTIAFYTESGVFIRASEINNLYTFTEDCYARIAIKTISGNYITPINIYNDILINIYAIGDKKTNLTVSF